MKQHKWHKEIKAWADGAEIEYKDSKGEWNNAVAPYWHNELEYRIKPQPKEPQYLYVYKEYGMPFVKVDKIESPDNGIVFIGRIKLEDDDNGNKK